MKNMVQVSLRMEKRLKERRKLLHLVISRFYVHVTYVNMPSASCHRFCPRIGSAATLFGEKFLLLSPLAVRTNDLGPALSSEIYRALFSPLEIY